MISSRAIVSASQTKSQAAAAGKDKDPALHQDDQGPLDGELLDLYVAILIVVPAAWVLRAFLL